MVKVELRVSLVAVGLCALLSIDGRAQTAEQQVVNDAAAAMGGAAKIRASKSLAVEGEGYDINFGQGLSWSETGVQSEVFRVTDYKRTYDLAAGRGRFEQARAAQFAYFQAQGAQKQVQALDGDVAFNVGANGNPARVFARGALNARKVEYLRQPLTLVRAALDPAVKLSNARTEGAERLVDVTTSGVTLSLAIDNTTKLPTRVVWMTDVAPLGDTAVETRFADYKDVNGLKLPTRMTTRNDRFTAADIRLTRLTVDGEIPSLAAPAAVTSATPPTPSPIPVKVEEVAKGTWFLSGQTHHSVLVEFADHLALVEAPNEDRTLAVIAKARELRPNKPLTTLIVTHHHVDHTSGVRAAVSEGLTDIVVHKNNVPYVQEILKRPHTIAPDALAKKPNAKPVKFIPVDDELVLKDGGMAVNLYYVRDNTHANNMLMLYFPGGRLLTQADIYMPDDARNVVPGYPKGHAPWNQNVLQNILIRKIAVDRHMPVHGELVAHSQFLESALRLTLLKETGTN